MIKNKRQMKRKYRLFILMLFAAVFAITACVDNNDGDYDGSGEELTGANHWGLSDAEWAEWLKQEALQADSMNIAYI